MLDYTTRNLAFPEALTMKGGDCAAFTLARPEDVIAISTNWDADGYPVLDVRCVHGAGFRISNRLDSPEYQGDGIRKFAAWYGVDDELLSRWERWIAQPQQEDRGSPYTHHAFRQELPGGEFNVQRVRCEDLLQVECGLDGETRVLKAQFKFGGAVLGQSFDAKNGDFIRVLARQLRCPPDAWLAWVGAPPTTKELASAVQDGVDGGGDELYADDCHPKE